MELLGKLFWLYLIHESLDEDILLCYVLEADVHSILADIGFESFLVVSLVEVDTVISLEVAFNRILLHSTVSDPFESFLAHINVRVSCVAEHEVCIIILGIDKDGLESSDSSLTNVLEFLFVLIKYVTDEIIAELVYISELEISVEFRCAYEIHDFLADFKWLPKKTKTGVAGSYPDVTSVSHLVKVTECFVLSDSTEPGEE